MESSLGKAALRHSCARLGGGLRIGLVPEPNQPAELADSSPQADLEWLIVRSCSIDRADLQSMYKAAVLSFGRLGSLMTTLPCNPIRGTRWMKQM